MRIDRFVHFGACHLYRLMCHYNMDRLTEWIRTVDGNSIRCENGHLFVSMHKYHSVHDDFSHVVLTRIEPFGDQSYRRSSKEGIHLVSWLEYRLKNLIPFVHDFESCFLGY